MARVRLFAAAEEAAGTAELSLEAESFGELRRALHAHSAELAAILPRCAVLVDGSRVDDAEPVTGASVVDVLPPFAGG